MALFKNAFIKFLFSRALKAAQAKLKTQQQMNAQLEEQRKKEEVRKKTKYDRTNFD